LILLAIGLEGSLLVTRFGFEWLGANVTDQVVRMIYRYSGLPGTLQTASTGTHSFDFGALIWLGLAAVLWLGVAQRRILLPRIFPSLARG
jgi:hypothetical protein